MHEHRTFLIVALAFALAACAGPTTYDDVAPLPRDAQLAAFVAASPAEKAAIYREHFIRYAGRADVTTEQRQALLRAASLVSPDWYDRQPGSASATCDEMERVIRGAFGDDAPRVTMVIGPE